MPLYREENFLVIHVGSEHSIFSFGLQDPLSPPEYKIPSVVYYNAETKQYSPTSGQPVRPLQNSKIVNMEAFQYLLKVILQSVVAQNPIITILQIPLLLIAPSNVWSRSQIEHITKYVMESLEFNAFNIIDLSVACNFGIGNGSNLFVVNLGKSSTQFTTVINYQNLKFASKVVNYGSELINEELAGILPGMLSEQIEALKISPIYEVVVNDVNSFYSIADLNRVLEGKNDEDQFDVAKLVIDNEQTSDTSKPNNELEKNSFVYNDQVLTVGKERFQGTTELLERLSADIYATLQKIPDIKKRQECFDNLIFVGSTFKIPGFKHALMTRLSYDFLVRSPQQQAERTANGVNLAIAAYQQSDEVNDNHEGEFNLSQVPNSIKLAKFPDYFPEWKKPKSSGGSWDDVYFLGGQIYAKQIFGGNSNANGELFVDVDNYEEIGPQIIWTTSL